MQTGRRPNSSPTSATYCCHGMSGRPAAWASAPTAGPKVGRLGVLGVQIAGAGPHCFGQEALEIVDRFGAAGT